MYHDIMEEHRHGVLDNYGSIPTRKEEAHCSKLIQFISLSGALPECNRNMQTDEFIYYHVTQVSELC